ncbi:pseudaminic acid cytidylyltransferase [Psychromonas sp. L1A2]|uniref:pseudaminic acid cytidylyltransferase n=1 Tax=Psychromonas sp. L1A2 TaxID=2686356 RepID=UPI0013567BD8|nr:pseudaminic acid cytidylyltransferase [Psychromonas sp. L1A2]
MSNIAIIPARGGSKRISNKNIKLFCGKPIIAYSIEAALQSGVFDAVLVSTDSEAIANIAKQYGAEVPFIRPDYLADDHTGTTDVIEHAITEWQNLGNKINLACCIYATAPFLQKKYIVDAINRLKAHATKRSAFTVCKFNYPIQRSFTIESSDSNVTPVDASSLPKRSQDLPDVYHDAGQFYIAKADDFLNQSFNIFSETSIPIILPHYLVQDIDDQDDWRRAEYMYQAFIADNEKLNADVMCKDLKNVRKIK